ncbi:MAG: DUF3285 domain-containing protein [Cyanobacteria bacterium J06642_2]
MTSSPELSSTRETSSDPSERVNPAETPFDSRYIAKPTDSYTKLAMRNMVRRGGTSLFHFALTAMAVLGTLVTLSVVFH